MAVSGFRVGKDMFLFEEERNVYVRCFGEGADRECCEILNKEEMSSGTQAWNLL